MNKMSAQLFTPSHVTIMRVPLFEIDLGQAMYHGSYFHIFEIGRDDFFRTIGFPYKSLMEVGYHLAIAQVTCAYFHGLRYDDEIQIHTGIKEIRSRSLSVIQRIDREGTVCTQAEFAMVCVKDRGKPSRIPDDFRTIISPWLIKEQTGELE